MREEPPVVVCVRRVGIISCGQQAASPGGIRLWLITPFFSFPLRDFRMVRGVRTHELEKTAPNYGARPLRQGGKRLASIRQMARDLKAPHDNKGAAPSLAKNRERDFLLVNNTQNIIIIRHTATRPHHRQSILVVWAPHSNHHHRQAILVVSSGYRSKNRYRGRSQVRVI